MTGQRNWETLMAAVYSSFIGRQSGKGKSLEMEVVYGLWHFHNNILKTGGGNGKIWKWRMSQIGSRHYSLDSKYSIEVYWWVWIVHCSSFTLWYCQLQNLGHTSREWSKMMSKKISPNEIKLFEGLENLLIHLTAPGFPLGSWAQVTVCEEFPLGSLAMLNWHSNQGVFLPHCSWDKLQTWLG